MVQRNVSLRLKSAARLDHIQRPLAGTLRPLHDLDGQPVLVVLAAGANGSARPRQRIAVAQVVVDLVALEHGQLLLLHEYCEDHFVNVNAANTVVYHVWPLAFDQIVRVLAVGDLVRMEQATLGDPIAGPVDFLVHSGSAQKR